MTKRNQNKNLILIIGAILAIFSLIGTQVNAQDLESTNFKIKGDLVATPGNDAESTNFKMNGDMNPFSNPNVSTNYKLNVGYNPRLQANKPTAPTLTNSSNYYDRLQISIDSAGNPSDTLYAVVVSTDDWTTFKYLKVGGTLGDTLTANDYQTYSTVNNSFITGLFSSTGYKAKVKALNGDFTETGYSETSNETQTDVPKITLALDNTTSDLGTLSASAIATASPAITLTISTNIVNGYSSAIKGTGSGLGAGLYNGANLIESGDVTLSTGTEGYGAQASSATATISTKYNKTGNEVGKVDIAENTLASNTEAVTNNTVAVTYKAAIAGSTPSGFYSDTVYYTISPSL